MVFSNDMVRSLRCAAVSSTSVEVRLSGVAVAKRPVDTLRQPDWGISDQRGRGDVASIAKGAGKIFP